MQGQLIYDYGKNPSNYGRLKKPTITYIEQNHTCGEYMLVDIILEGKNIKHISFEGDGRMVGIASMSLLIEDMENQEFSKIEDYKKQDILDMIEVESLTSKRLKSAMLGLLTLSNAYRTYHKKEKLDFADILEEEI